MPSTATEWLMEYDGDVASFEEMLVDAGVPVRALAEYPDWMKRSIANKLRDSFREEYWDDIVQTFGRDVSDYLQRGLRDGLSIRQMAKDMSERLGGGQYAKNRATNIARTEAAGALNGARREGMDELARELGINNWGEAPMRPVWLSVLGTTTRDTHADLDGVPCDKDGMWELGGVRVPHPGHPDLPPEERCNCFPAGVKVSGDFSGAYRVRYDGVVAEIVTMGGIHLTVTPNHPIMTLDGFIPASELKPGQKIVAHRLQIDNGIQLSARESAGKVGVGASKQIKHKPPSIEQVFEAFRSASISVEVKGAEVDDFYGDGQFMPGEIEIVRPDWKLLPDRITGLLEKRGDEVFILMDRNTSEVSGSGPGGPNSRTFDLPPPGFPSPAEPSFRVLIGSITPAGSLAVGIASDFNPPFSKPSDQNRPAITAFLRQALKRHSGLVSLDEVVKVRYFNTTSHVYDLQSCCGVIVAEGSLYTDNPDTGMGIVTGNCQCTTVTELGLRDEEAQRLIGDYYARARERSIELRTKNVPAEARLGERERHNDWEELLNQDEEFAAVLQAPLASEDKAQELADRVTTRLDVPNVRVVFHDGSSSVGDGRLADYDKSEPAVAFYAEPEAATTSVLVHELAHHTQQVLRGQSAHGAGHNKHFRIVAEALLSAVLEREVDLNEWFREGKGGTKSEGSWVTTEAGNRLFLGNDGVLRTSPGGQAIGSSSSGSSSSSAKAKLEELPRYPTGMVKLGSLMETVEEEPYEEVAIHNKKTDLEPSKLNLDELTATQGWAEASTISDYIDNPDKAPTIGITDKPIVVKAGNSYYIHDGHHRIAAWKLLGRTEGDVLVYKGRMKRQEWEDDDDWWDDDD